MVFFTMNKFVTRPESICGQYRAFHAFLAARILLVIRCRQNPADFPESSCLVAKNSPSCNEDGRFVF
jgi:hypothetical protein